MEQKYTTYLSLGSNLDNRLENLKISVQRIHERIGLIKKMSSIYKTPAQGFQGNYFYNICIELKTAYSPRELLKKILEIEKSFGRIRNKSNTYKNRNIDIDIILYENITIKTPYLSIPHPKTLERKFVLLPLSEIAKEKNFPNHNKTIFEFLKECPDKSLAEVIQSKIDIKNCKKY